jgi:chromosome segregation ATPase
VGYGARGRREALRQLNDLRRRLAAAQDGLAGAQATVKRAEAAFDAASDRFAEAERALDAARAERAQARRDRYAAQQAHDRASTAVERLQRRARELSDRLGGMPLITRKPGHGPHITTVTSPGTPSPSFVHMF